MADQHPSLINLSILTGSLFLSKTICFRSGAEEQRCLPEPLSQDYTFRVTQRKLQKDQVLGKGESHLQM